MQPNAAGAKGCMGTLQCHATPMQLHATPASTCLACCVRRASAMPPPCNPAQRVQGTAWGSLLATPGYPHEAHATTAPITNPADTAHGPLQLTPSPPPPQSVRTSKVVVGTTQVTLNQFPGLPITDPQGFTGATITIMGVQADRPPQACTCKTSKTDSCGCVPDAKLIEGSPTALIMPQVQFGTGGTTYRITYTATISQTGLSCQGYADVCFIKNAGKPTAKSCAWFGGNGSPVRNALACA